MSADFDHIADQYDRDFTQSAVGIAQRGLVYAALEKSFPSLNGLNVLELNCGTGEDAKYFAKNGAKVIATDISESMISVAEEKAKSISNMKCETLDINKINQWNNTEKFDLVFSNFGGLNCLSDVELKQFFKNISLKLESKGHLVLVVMANKCWWESLYFIGKLNFNEAFRRNKKEGVWARVEGQKVKTYYYAPNEIVHIAEGFKVGQISPIGFCVPPSYLNPVFQNRPQVLQKMVQIDKMHQNNWKRAAYSDHFLIHLYKQ
jgi:ubiquinone/menaquinone biosynthesis C-methylase UbiE